VAEEAARRFVALAGEAIEQRGHFAVALAGGGTPAGLYRRLAQEPQRGQVNWPRVWVFFGDERCVPPDNAESNYRMARETLLASVPLAEQNIHRVHGEKPAEQAAAQYAQELRAKLGPGPSFDLVLLGMGEDGHTASLFPGMPALAIRDEWVVASDVPVYVRPQVRRVTLTLPVLNAARQVLFLVAGGNKAGAVRAVLGEQEAAQPLPAALVRPEAGGLTWLLDRAAATEMKH
jgi:6-phosphogluconolactonase